MKDDVLLGNKIVHSCCYADVVAMKETALVAVKRIHIFIYYLLSTFDLFENLY